MILGGRSCSTSSFRHLNRNGKTWRWRASIAKAPKKGTNVSIQTTVSPHVWPTMPWNLTDRQTVVCTFSSKSSPRRENSLSFECSLWNEKGETENTQSINPVRAEKRERLAEAGLFFFLLVKHNIYCPFCSTNAKPDVRVLRWLTRVSSGSVELLSDGKRIGALTFILLLDCLIFHQGPKATRAVC